MTKYRIALCEDEKVFSETQERIFREVLEKLNIEYSINVFESGEDFLASFSGGGKRYDFILLDIFMGDINGMDIAKRIRETDEEAAIVFMTSSREYAVESYDVNALYYLIKPLEPAILERLIAKAYRDRFQDNYFILKTHSQNKRIPIKDIVSLETKNRKVEITLNDGSLNYSGKLAELLSELPSDLFIRCHQAYAVNIRNIRELDRFNAVTVNGKLIPISRPYLKDVQRAFLRNIQEN